MNRVRSLIAVLILALAAGAVAQADALPEGPGRDLVLATCQTCHGLDFIVGSTFSRSRWEGLVHQMISFGLVVTDDEFEEIVDYLASYLGTEPPLEQGEAGDGADASEDDLDGEALYLTNCSSCHQAQGQGVRGAFPPLAGHVPALYRAEEGRDYLAHVVLYGLRGPITVEGAQYHGAMPPWPHLSDAAIAAILNHTLTAWGNDELLDEDFEPYRAEEVAAERDLDLGPGEVQGRRPEVGEGE
ncbi:MAG: c-type cytochrome [Deinococcota bacterium]|jgi:mono/diheme cytochrome c family protein|nr:c-type cytochrome [Deinococcota bacterium]